VSQKQQNKTKGRFLSKFHIATTSQRGCIVTKVSAFFSGIKYFCTLTVATRAVGCYLKQNKYLPFFDMKMLSYAKHILTRVSFDALLFEKELRKAINMLIGDEVQELKNWCYANFSREHEAILNRCFVRA